jgi:hypothetical protein
MCGLTEPPRIRDFVRIRFRPSSTDPAAHSVPGLQELDDAGGHGANTGGDAGASCGRYFAECTDTMDVRAEWRRLPDLSFVPFVLSD